MCISSVENTWIGNRNQGLKDLLQGYFFVSDLYFRICAAARMVGPSQGIALVKEKKLQTDIHQFLIETKFSKFLDFLNKYYQLSTYHSIAIAILEVFFTTIGDFLATVESLSAIFLDYRLSFQLLEYQLWEVN